MDSISTLKPGTLLHTGTYRIISFLAKGGFGCTYLAEHLLLEEKVAIKELFVSEWCNRDESGTISVAVTSKIPMVEHLHSKFIDEAKAQRRMNHPGVVKVSDVFEENGTAYYVMDYIDGESLKDKMQRFKHGMPEAKALGYIRQVADALAYVHSQNRLHLDIKPANIMVDHQDRAILIDFGVSKQYDADSGENHSSLVGMTSGYSSPEQMAKEMKFFSPASDIYSLGATLYNLLTNEVIPDTIKRSSGEPVKPLPSTISLTTRRAIESAIHLEKTLRPKNMNDFVQLFNNFCVSEETQTGQESDIDKINYDKKEVTFTPKQKKFLWLKGKWGFADDNGNWLISPKFDEVKGFSEGLAPIKLIDKWGYIDMQSRMIIKPQYYGADIFREGIAPVKIGDKWGYIDKKCNWIIPPKYECAEPFKEGFASVSANGMASGYIDKKGNWIIPPQFIVASDFSEGLAGVCNDDLEWGYIDKKGQWIIDPVYDFASEFSKGEAIVQLDGVLFKIDKTGNRLTDKTLLF